MNLSSTLRIINKFGELLGMYSSIPSPIFVINRINNPVNIEFFLPNQPIVTLWSFEKITLESPSAHITADT